MASSTDSLTSAPGPSGPPKKQMTGIRSIENGHVVSQMQPMSKHTGESVSTFFTGMFNTIIAVSTLGASITFNYVVSDKPATHPRSLFGAAEVQIFLAVSWLLFLLSLAMSAIGSTMLTFFKEYWKADWDCKNGVRSRIHVQLYATGVSGLLSALVVAAFIFLCLVVIAYTPVVGWIALTFTALFGGALLLNVLYQAPWWWRKSVELPPKSNAP